MTINKRTIARIRRRAIARFSVPAQQNLPGFDAKQYLNFNQDVKSHLKSESDINAAAKAHYVKFGMQEMRRVFPDGSGVDDPQSRLLPNELHDDTEGHRGWKAAAENLARMRKVAVSQLVASHPRAIWLGAGFNVPSYALKHPELLKESFDHDLLTLHFLEFGLERGASGHPELWDPKVLKSLYGVDLSEDLNGPEALRELRKLKGFGPYALNEAELFILNGFAPMLTEIFEADYSHNISIASMKKAEGKPRSRLQIIQLFCQTGWKNVQPVHPDLLFDADFYEESYGPIDGLSSDVSHEAALYRHWLSIGIMQHKSPNLSQLGKAIFGMDVPDELLAQIKKFAMGSNDLNTDCTLQAALEHMYHAPRPGLDFLDISARTSKSFVRNLGDRKVIEGYPDLGCWLYRLVLDADPKHIKANVALADLLQRSSDDLTARALRRNVPISRENGWNSLNLVDLLIKQGKFSEAAQILLDSAPHVEHDIIMRGVHKSHAANAFWILWNKVADQSEIYGLENVQNDLRAILRSYSPSPAHRSANRSAPIKSVALVGNQDLYQCKLYRIDQKAEQLRKAGFQVQVFSSSHELDQFTSNLDHFQAVIFFRVPAFPAIMDAILQAGQAGLSTFYEIDDIVFDTDHFPPSFESYANQITQREYNAMACGVPLFERAMELCEYGIASTATLREIMEKKVQSGKVFEHQNALGRLHLLAMSDHEHTTKKASAPLVLFYGSGTKAHKEDFHDILEPALAAMARKHGRKIEIRLIGHFDTFKHLDTKKGNVKILEPVWDFEAYCGLLAEADINLSVLSPSVLTDAKSEIKWMEAAMFGTPSVVSATRTHCEKIDDGKTGLLCKTKEDFTAGLDRLIGDTEFRKTLGQAARAQVIQEYSLNAMGENLRGIFEAVRPAGVRKKRIAIVNVFYPPQAIGGATRVVHDNVKLLHEKYGDTYDIDVICSYEGGTVPHKVERYARDGVRVWAIATPDIPDVEQRLEDKEMAQTFNTILDQIKPDLVHFHCIQRLTMSIIDVTRLQQIPYFITMHDAWWISKNQFALDNFGTESYYDYSLDKLELPERAQHLRKGLFGADAILPVSQAFGKVVAKAGIKNTTVVENGVSSLPQVVREPSQNGKVRLAHIGGVSHHKGFHHVRNTLLTTEFDNLELLVVDHSLSPDMEIRETWGTTPVIRRGKFPQDEVENLYAQIDVLLAPSTWPESYGLVTREALASGAWVVASDQGAIGSDVTVGENGFVVDVSTNEGVKKALLEIDVDPERYRQAPDSVPELRGVEAQVDELNALYLQFINATPF